MENTRTLKDEEVPQEAVESVHEMTKEMIDGIVSDFLEQLQLKGLTLDQKGINQLKTQVRENSRITLKISMKVDIDLVHDLEIPIRDANQASIGSF